MWRLGCLALAAAACGPLDEPFDGPPPDDPCAGVAEDLSGLWSITGSGSRTGCDDERFDAPDLQIDSALLDVVQDGATLMLRVPEADFELAGRVEGICVDFSTTERTEVGTVSFDWSGEARGGVVQGNFDGAGPAGCRSTGRFTLRVR